MSILRQLFNADIAEKMLCAMFSYYIIPRFLRSFTTASYGRLGSLTRSSNAARSSASSAMLNCMASLTRSETDRSVSAAFRRRARWISGSKYIVALFDVVSITRIQRHDVITSICLCSPDAAKRNPGRCISGANIHKNVMPAQVGNQRLFLAPRHSSLAPVQVRCPCQQRRSLLLAYELQKGSVPFTCFTCLCSPDAAKRNPGRCSSL